MVFLDLKILCEQDRSGRYSACMSKDTELLLTSHLLVAERHYVELRNAAKEIARQPKEKDVKWWSKTVDFWNEKLEENKKLREFIKDFKECEE